MNNVFLKEVTTDLVDRISALNIASKAIWGTMSVDKMLAHCCVTYEMVYEEKHSKPNVFIKIFLKLFVKWAVVGDKSYSKNGRTAPQFLISDPKDFEIEKKRLIDFLIRTQKLGANYFEGKESHSFGRLSSKQWNIMFYKHLDHHLTQFGS